MQPSKSNASGWHALKMIWVGDNITPKSLVPLQLKSDQGRKLSRNVVEEGKKTEQN